VKCDNNADHKQIITSWKVRARAMITEFVENKSHTRRARVQEGNGMELRKKEIRMERKMANVSSNPVR
jgi:hypothetical protein